MVGNNPRVATAVSVGWAGIFGTLALCTKFPPAVIPIFVSGVGTTVATSRTIEKEYKHDAVEFIYDKNGKENCITLEFSSDGTELAHGGYTIKTVYQSISIDMKVKDVFKTYNSVWSSTRERKGSDYNLLTKNCKHYSRNIFNHIH